MAVKVHHNRHHTVLLAQGIPCASEWQSNFGGQNLSAEAVEFYLNSDFSGEKGFEITQGARQAVTDFLYGINIHDTLVSSQSGNLRVPDA